MIEFAISAPVLITLGLAGAEVTHMAVAVMRVNQISTAISDNVARVRDSIDESDVNEALLSAKFIGTGLAFNANGRVVVSSVEPNGQAGTKAGQYIRWQRCTGALNAPESQPKYGAEGKGQNDASLPYMGTSTRQIAAGTGSSLIFVEVTYRYQPLVSSRFLEHRSCGPNLSITCASVTHRFWDPRPEPPRASVRHTLHDRTGRVSPAGT
ncbi:pilus assembly protein [Sphingomonas sp. 22L2VL55-3]